jgi:hypothetical protein
MKFGFLCHQIRDQFFGPINRDLIWYAPLYPAIPLNVLVDLYALLAHGSSAFARGAANSHHVYKTANRRICSFLFSRRLVVKTDHHPAAVPKLDIVAIEQPLCLIGCVIVVCANNRLEPDEMPVASDGVSPIFLHPGFNSMVATHH